jgi:hypothetical protein
MRKKLQLLFALTLIAVLLVSCSSAPEVEPVIEEVAPEVVEDEALLVGDVSFTQSQLEGMETVEVEYTGKDDAVTVYAGVLVLDLVAEAGLSGETVVFVASDGYEAELALAELIDFSVTVRPNLAECVDSKLRQLDPQRG